MALAAVLSAMRCLILDSPPLPASQSGRFSALREMFPALSAAEAEDMAKMDPKRLNIYTTSIFKGETDLLVSYFKATAAVLARSFELQNRSLNLISFVRHLHHFHPWKTWNTEGLIESFSLALSDPRVEVGPLRREILELARFERHLFYARRVPTGPFEPAASLLLNDLAELTVGEILELRWKMPESVYLDTFTLDMGRILSAFRRNGGMLPEVFDERNVEIAFSRDRENAVRWRELPSALFRYFRAGRVEGGILAEMAEAVLQDLPEVTPEDEGFRRFLEALRGVLESGIIVIQKSS